jgi:hypothetical protein
MNNEEISDAVNTIFAAIPQGRSKTPDDDAAIAAGRALVTNLLQNINEIALHASHPQYMVTMPSHLNPLMPMGGWTIDPKSVGQP